MAEDDDPFGHLTTICHVSSPQRPFLGRSASFSGHFSDHSPAPESAVIRMESPPEEEEFLTPQEDSLPAVDLGKRDSESTVVIESGDDDDDGFKVVGRLTGFKRERGLDEREGLECCVDLGADEVFDEMPVREREVEKMDVGEGFVGLDEGISTEVVDLDGNETCGGFFMGKGGVEKGPFENLSRKVVDLDGKETFGDFCMGKGGVEKGPFENLSRKVVDLDGKETFGDFCMGKGGVEKGPFENLSRKVVDLDEKETRGDFCMEKGPDGNLSRKVVGLDENETCGDLFMRNGGVKKGPNKDLSRKVGDLDIGDLGMGNGGVEKGPNEKLSRKVADLGESGRIGDLCKRNGGVGKGRNEDVSMEDVSLDENERVGDLCMRNGGVERGPNEDVSMEDVDLDENETCGDLCITNRGVEKGLDEDVSTEVVDLDENEMCGDLCMRNGGVERGPNDIISKEVGDLTMGYVVGEVGTDEGDEVRRDEFRGFYEKGIEKIGNRKFVASKNDENKQKDEGIGGWRGLYDDLSKKGQMIEKLLRKVDERCREESRGSNEKGIEENDRFQRVGEDNDKFCQKGKCVDGPRKLDDLPRRNPCRDGIRGLVKENDFQKGDNICQKGKGPAQARKLPSSLDMLADIALGDASHRERNRGFVEKNRHESNDSKRVGGSREMPSLVGGQTNNSTDQTKNNLIMKNLLDALGLVTGGEREKVDDESDEEIDFLETAMIQGIVFPRPRWWPSEEFDDD